MASWTSIPRADDPSYGIEGVEVFPLADAARAGPLRIVVTHAPRQAHSESVAREWRRLCDANPRLFDGPLLSVTHCGPAGHAGEASNEILVRTDGFARLAVQQHEGGVRGGGVRAGVRTGVRILSVTGVLIARDEAGQAHMLLGRRGRGTRVYGGMWELGPSGGLGVPPANVRELDERSAMHHLADEVMEEVGVGVQEGRGVCIARDHVAMSDDIVFVCELGALSALRGRAGPANWEYEETRWVAVQGVRAFDEANAGEIIAPTRAIFRAFGWV